MGSNPAGPTSISAAFRSPGNRFQRCHLTPEFDGWRRTQAMHALYFARAAPALLWQSPRRHFAERSSRPVARPFLANVRANRLIAPPSAFIAPTSHTIARASPPLRRLPRPLRQPPPSLRGVPTQLRRYPPPLNGLPPHCADLRTDCTHLRTSRTDHPPCCAVHRTRCTHLTLYCAARPPE